MLASFQCRGIDLIEGNVLIRFEKRCRLASAQIIEIRIHTTTLHNVLEVKIRLAVPYEVNFFTDQFCIILALLPTQAGKNREIVES